MLDRVEIEKLKQSLDVERFVRDHFDRVSGGSLQMSTRCPGHADNRNSLSICVDGPRRGQWTCHAGCGPEGRRDIVNLIQMIHGTTFGDALAYLQDYVEKGHLRPASVTSDSFPVETAEPYKPDMKWIEDCQERLFGSMGEYWIKFLEERKISLKVAAIFKIGVDDNGNLVIPAQDINGEIRGCRFRAMDGSRWWAKNSRASQILYGLLPDTDEVKSKIVYICEGETDALSLLSQDTGSPRVWNVLATFGAKVAWREEWTDGLKTFGADRIVICGDNDRAGRSMNQDIFDSLTKQGYLPEQVYMLDWAKMADALVMSEVPEKFDINEAIKAGVSLRQIELSTKPIPTIASVIQNTQVHIAMQAEVPTDETASLDLPDSAWPPMLAEMRDALHLRVPTPDPMIMGSLLALTSHIVGRRCSTTVFGRHVPAMYCMNVADTNIGKSAILDYMSQELFVKLNPMLRMAGTPITTYGFFGSAEGVGAAYKDVADSRVLQMADEYSTQLMKAKSDGGGPVIQAILSLWQGSAQGSIAKGGGWDLTGKHLAIAAATTKVYLHTHMRKEDVMGGYANRFCYWLGFRHQARKVYITQDPDPRVVQDFCDTLVQMSRDICGAHGPTPQRLINPTAEARDLAINWMEGFEKELTTMEETQVLVTNRIPSHIARIATLFALLDLNTQITATSMRRAIEVGEYLKKSVWHLFGDYGMSGPTAAASWIVTKIEEAGGRVNKRDLQQRIPIRHREDFSRAIADLQRQGILLEESTGKKKFWTLAEVEAVTNG